MSLADLVFTMLAGFPLLGAAAAVAGHLLGKPGQPTPRIVVAAMWVSAVGVLANAALVVVVPGIQLAFGMDKVFALVLAYAASIIVFLNLGALARRVR